MTRRLLGVCLALAALSGLTARASAKPPDLPEDQKITVTPLRVQNFESVLPVSAAPAEGPDPAAAPGWPHELETCLAGEFAGIAVAVQETTASLLFSVGVQSDSGLTGCMALHEHSFLILPGGPAGPGRRVIVRLRPADRRVLATSVLFTAHPFLTLMPVDVVVEEEDGYEVEDVCHPQAAPPPGQSAPKPIRPRTSCDPAGEHLGMPREEGFTCPYLREKQAADRHVRMLADEDLSRGVMENLRRLEMAARGLEAAKDLARRGRTCEALACLEVVSELCPGSSFDRRVAEVWAGVLAGAYDRRHASEAAKGKRTGKVCPRQKEQKVGRWLQSKVSIDCKDMPLQVAINRLGGCKRVRVVFDLPALNEDGINLDTPVSIQLQDVSRKSALNLMLQRVDLRYVVKDGVVVITTEAGARDEPVMRTYYIGDLVATWQADPTSCGERMDNCAPSVPEQVVRLVMNTIAPRSWSAQGGRGTIDYCPLTQALVVSQPPDLQEQVGELLTVLRRLHHAGETSPEPAPAAEPQVACPPCPKAQALHARVAGVKEQVDGLMKACHLAMADRRYEKAAELAREAHALDPLRVEADPLVYKMHLLAEECGKDSKKPACPPKPKGPPCPAGPSNYPQQKAVPGATKLPSPRPTLPPVDPGVVGALEEVAADKDALGRPCGATPAYDVERVGRRLDGAPAPQPTEGITGPSATREQKAMAQVLDAVLEAFATDHPLGVGVAINLDGGGVRVYYTAPFHGEVYHLLYQGGFGAWKTPAPAKQEK